MRSSLALLLWVGLLDAGIRWGSAEAPALALTAQAPDALLAGASAQASLDRDAPHCSDYRVVREGLIPMPAGVPAAHASSLVALPSNHALHAQKALAAFWFAGTRESAADVQIAASTFDREAQAWDAPQWVVNRHTLGRELGIQIRRIGNPVAWVDAAGRMHLFLVATGLGGWAASRVVHLAEQAPLQFHAVRTLPLTALVPAFNTSTLVRTAPLALADGGAVLPLYFEIGIKYGVAVRLNARGEMQGITRITQRRDVLQPTLVAHTPTHWSAFMRDHSSTQRVAHSESLDAGAHWRDVGSLALSNPGASVAALHLSSGGVMLAHNPAERKREVLQLSTSAHAPLAWTTRTLVDGAPADEYSYPTLIEVAQPLAHETASPSAPLSIASAITPKKGSAPLPPDVWLSYTHLRQAIAFKQLRAHCSPRSQP